MTNNKWRGRGLACCAPAVRVSRARSVLLFLAALLLLLGCEETAPKLELREYQQQGSALGSSVGGAHETVWVLMKQQADLSSAKLIKDWAQRGREVHERLTRTALTSQAAVHSLVQTASPSAKVKPFWIVNSFQLTADKATIASVEADPAVAGVYPDRVLEVPPVTPGAPEPSVDGVEWGVSAIRAPEVWAAFGTRGEGIVVANIDTGVHFEHPALVRQYKGNQGGFFEHNYNWFDPGSECPSAEPCDDDRHGTHTMGTMLGADGNPGENEIGVAPGAQWIAAKGCGVSGCPRSSLLAAGEWILAPTDLNGQDPRPELRPNIVNNSWGGPTLDPWYQATVRAWVAAGIFPAMSGGNRGSACGTAGAPGAYDESYSAGAFASNGEIAGFSSRGTGLNGVIKPNIAAPGVNVRSAVLDGGYAALNGTSMASPHVAGVVALMWSAAPSLVGDVELTRSLLDQTAIDTSDTSCGGTAQHNNVWGEGKLNAFAAVELSPRGPTGTLAGIVTDDDGVGIAGALVEATGPSSRSASTDGAGRFSMSLPVGVYGVTGSALGHFPASLEGQGIAEGATTNVSLSLAVAPRFDLGGTVTVNGESISGVEVSLSGTLLSTTTDNNGQYSFPGLLAGEYSLLVEAGDGCAEKETRAVSLFQNRVEDFQLTKRRDAFGYGCELVAGAYVDATTKVTLSGDDSAAMVALPFPFLFYGESYDTLFVSTNGYLSFGAESSVYINGSLPSPSEPNSALYPYWDDLVVDQLASVWSETVGSAPHRTFVIEYRNVRFFEGIGRIDFQVLLGESGVVRFQYRGLDGSLEQGSSATVGVENAAGTVALQYSRNEPVLRSAMAIEFSLGTEDSEPPSVVLTAPSDGAVLSGLALVAADASDDVAVDRVEFYAGLGTDSELLIGTDRAAPFAVSWNTAQASPGAHQLTARAFDPAGNFTDSSELGVVVDNPEDTEPPTVSISAPGDGALVAGLVTIAVDANDDVGIDTVQLAIDGAVIDSVSAAPFEFNWDSSGQSDGPHQVQAIARDLAGNVQTSASLSVNTDNSGPLIALTAPGPGALVAGGVLFAADASDPAGVVRVDFSVDGVVVASDATPPFSADWDASTVVDGVHEIAAVAVDALGNTNVAAVDIVSDNTAPVLTLLSPGEGEVVSGLVTISASASDATSGVAQVEFAVDGVVLSSDETAPFTALWDAGAAAAGTHVLTVTASDVAGNGGALDTVDVTVAGPFHYSWFEAELGAPDSPLRVTADANASAGHFMEVTPGNNSLGSPPEEGRASYAFNVGSPGTFRIWGRTIAPSTSDDSFWVRVDAGSWARWNFIPGSTTWQWDDVHQEDNGSQTELLYDLAAGTHSITVAYREDGAQLDRLLVTDDLSFVPTGIGLNQPGPTTGLGAVAGDGEVALTWSPAEAADSYTVKRGVRGGPHSEVESGIPELSYTDSGLTNGVEYCYVVAAENAAGAGEESPESCATPDLACQSDADCDDGLACNGAERCLAAECVAGAPIDCDDGVSCTADSCDPATAGCVHVAEHAVCGDGVFCNGTEICDPVLDCVAGPVPDCEDGIACTSETCDVETDACSYTADDAMCNDELFCNGAEVCDLVAGCVDSADPCPLDACDEAGDVCTAECVVDADCDDAVFCNGAEICSAGACVSGTVPDCDDGVECTADSCEASSDSCTHVGDDTVCDDGLFCNGAETCQLTSGCGVGSDPCPGATCNEESASCETGCASDAECDDAEYCNGQERCEGGQCQSGSEQGQACYDASPLARNQQSGSFNSTEEVWFVLTADPHGWQASEVQGREIFVNGQRVSPGQMPLPAAVNGERYFQFTAGARPWSSWSFW